MLKNTRDKKGWLLPYLVSLDNMFYKRWDYWLRIIHNDKIPQDRIPYIVFKPSFEYTKKEVQKNLKDCLNLAVHISNPDFFTGKLQTTGLKLHQSIWAGITLWAIFRHRATWLR
jgi:hypothetical protein